MKYTTNVVKVKNIDDLLVEVNIYHLFLDDLSKISEIIENEIVDIWDPSIAFSLNEVKKDIYNVILTKSDNQKHGICAEFFMHLFLRNLKFSQLCLFSNLEESSMKKGFDGLYEFSNDFWIAESKSAIVESKHKDKIKEALNDINQRIENSKEKKKNPWKNAIHHMMIRKKDNSGSLAKKIQSLSRDYINDISHKSYEFNIIPASTLFVDNNQSDEEITSDIKSLLLSRKFKKRIIIKWRYRRL